VADDSIVRIERAKASDAGRLLDEGRVRTGGRDPSVGDEYRRGLAPELQGIKIVDCDTHFSEPPDL